jgi:hypothetical protein
MALAFEIESRTNGSPSWVRATRWLRHIRNSRCSFVLSFDKGMHGLYTHILRKGIMVTAGGTHFGNLPRSVYEILSWDILDAVLED